VAVAVLLIRLVLRDIARPFHSAGADIRSNADQLSTALQRLASNARQGGRPQPGRGRPAGRRREPHTGRGECGKIGATGSGPTRHRETGIRLADQQVIGKVGRVTGTIGPDQVGEVMIAIRGGSEAFNAYAADTTDTISTGTRVVVIEYFPPRTVVVSPM
jgi:hypothetical protein